MNQRDLPRQLDRLLRRIPTLALATVDQAGLPHVANVNFVSDDELNIYFLSAPDSAHCQHIARRPRVAACGYPTFRLPHRIRGVQLYGRCRPCPDEQWPEHWRRFCRKFPYAMAYRRRARAERFYCLMPAWFRLIDNSVRFGFKLETDWPPSDG